MTETISVLAAQRANDNDLCKELRKGSVELGHRVSFDAATTHKAADRIVELSQELAEASHDRDRYQADLERLRAEHTDCIPVSKFPVFYPTED